VAVVAETFLEMVLMEDLVVIITELVFLVKDFLEELRALVAVVVLVVLENQIVGDLGVELELQLQ
jgi:hypothetical protein